MATGGDRRTSATSAASGSGLHLPISSMASSIGFSSINSKVSAAASASGLGSISSAFSSTTTTSQQQPGPKSRSGFSLPLTTSNNLPTMLPKATSAAGAAGAASTLLDGPGGSSLYTNAAAVPTTFTHLQPHINISNSGSINPATNLLTSSTSLASATSTSAAPSVTSGNPRSLLGVSYNAPNGSSSLHSTTASTTILQGGMDHLSLATSTAGASAASASNLAQSKRCRFALKDTSTSRAAAATGGWNTSTSSNASTVIEQQNYQHHAPPGHSSHRNGGHGGHGGQRRSRSPGPRMLNSHHDLDPYHQQHLGADVGLHPGYEIAESKITGASSASRLTAANNNLQVSNHQHHHHLLNSSSATSRGQATKQPQGMQFKAPLMIEQAEELMLLAKTGKVLPPGLQVLTSMPVRPKGGTMFLILTKTFQRSDTQDGYLWTEILHQADLVTSKGNSLDYRHYYISTSLDGRRTRTSSKFRREAYTMGDLTLVTYIGDEKEYAAASKVNAAAAAAADQGLGGKPPPMPVSLQGTTFHSLPRSHRYDKRSSGRGHAGEQLMGGLGGSNLKSSKLHHHAGSTPSISGGRPRSLERLRDRKVDMLEHELQLKRLQAMRGGDPGGGGSYNPTAMVPSHRQSELMAISEELVAGKLVKNLTLFPSVQITLVHPDMTREFEHACQVLYSDPLLLIGPSTITQPTDGIRLFYDITFPLGRLHATILTYVNPCYEGHPIMPLAVNIHERQFKSSHALFWARVVGDIPALHKHRFPLLIDDAEPAVHLAVRSQAPNLVQLEGWSHRFRDIDRYLRTKGYGEEAINYFKACVCYLLNSASKQSMHDRFRKEFEYVWPKDFVLYYRQRLLPRSGRLGRWAMSKLNICEANFLSPHSNPQERFHRLVKDFAGWQHLSVEQMVRAFNFLFTFFINELSLRDSGNGAFVLKTAYQPQFGEFQHPRLQNVSRIPHPTEIAPLVAKQYPAIHPRGGAGSGMDFRPRVLAYSDATAFAHASNYDDVQRIEDALDKMFRESEEEDAAMLSSLSHIQASDFIRIDGRPRHASGPAGHGAVAGQHQLHHQRDRQAKYAHAGPNFSSSLSSNVPSPAPNGQVPSPAPPDQINIISATPGAPAGSAPGLTASTTTTGASAAAAAAAEAAAAPAGIGGGSTNTNTSHTTNSSYQAPPLRSTALSTIPEHHPEHHGETPSGPPRGGPHHPAGIKPRGGPNNNNLNLNLNNNGGKNGNNDHHHHLQMMNRQNMQQQRPPGISALKAGGNNKPVITSSSGGGYPPDLLVHSNWQEHSFDSSVVTEGHYDASFESEAPPLGASMDEPQLSSTATTTGSATAASGPQHHQAAISKPRPPPISQTSKKSVFSMSAVNNSGPPPPGGPPSMGVGVTPHGRPPGPSAASNPGQGQGQPGQPGQGQGQGAGGVANSLMLWKKVQHYVVVGGAFVQGSQQGGGAGTEGVPVTTTTASATSNQGQQPLPLTASGSTNLGKPPQPPGSAVVSAVPAAAVT